MSEDTENKDNKSKKRIQSKIATGIDSRLGNIQPQAIEVEQVILGAAMLENNALSDIVEIVSSNMFYLEKHAKIYSAIDRLFRRSEPVDLITVAEELKKSGELEAVGGRGYLMSLTENVSAASHIDAHAKKLVEKHLLRELIRFSNNTLTAAYDETTDVFELLDTAERNLFAIAETNIRQKELSMAELVRKAQKEILEKSKKKGSFSGLATGFDELDKVTSGFQNSDLIILAARPGMGKTAFVLSMARNIAVEYGNAVAFFSLEMSATQLVTRLIASECMIDASTLKSGKLTDAEWEILNTKTSRLAEAPIYIDDTPALSIFELRAKARRLKAKHDIKILIIDYLQLMTAGGDKKLGNRVEEISQITRSLKQLAKELDIPVVCLSQLNRSVETRGGDKKPILSDLRESGSIEQDADIVAFIYRPEYYKIDKDKDGNVLDNIAQILIQKHRNGNCKDINLKFLNKYTRFENLSDSDYNIIENHLTETSTGNTSNRVTLPSKMNDEIDSVDPAF